MIFNISILKQITFDLWLNQNYYNIHLLSVTINKLETTYLQVDFCSLCVNIFFHFAKVIWLKSLIRRGRELIGQYLICMCIERELFVDGFNNALHWWIWIQLD